MSLFVYGTLKRGHVNNHVVQGWYVRDYTLYDYVMVDLGRFPGIVRCPGSRVLGELWEVTNILALDAFEGPLYERVEVYTGVWAYVLKTKEVW